MKKITLLTLLALVTFSCTSEQEKQKQIREEQKAKREKMYEKRKQQILKGVELTEEELQAEKEFGF